MNSSQQSALSNQPTLYRKGREGRKGIKILDFNFSLRSLRPLRSRPWLTAVLLPVTIEVCIDLLEDSWTR